MSIVAAVVPPAMRPSCVQGSEETARPVRKKTEPSESARRSSEEHGSVHAAEGGADIPHEKAASAEQSESFEQTLKKRLEKQTCGESQVGPDGDALPEDGDGQAAEALAMQAAGMLVVKAAASDAKPVQKTVGKQEVEDGFARQPLPVRTKPADGTASEKTASSRQAIANHNASAEDAAAKSTAKPLHTSSSHTPSPAKDSELTEHAETASKHAVEGLAARAKPAEDAEPIRRRGTDRAAAAGHFSDVRNFRATAKSVSEGRSIQTVPGTIPARSNPAAASSQPVYEQDAETSSTRDEIAAPKLNTDKKPAAESATAEAKDAKPIEKYAANDPAPSQSRSTAESTPETSAPAPVAQTSTSAASVESAKAAAGIGAARPIDQIVQALQHRTFGVEPQVRMTLAPEELGAIRITFRQTGNEVVGLLEVQKNETRKEIERSVSQLSAAMENAGVHVRRIEVVPWTNQQNTRGEQFSQEFDARSHQEMYRPDGERLPHQGRRGTAANTEAHESATNPMTGRQPGQSEAGLNFFV